MGDEHNKCLHEGDWMLVKDHVKEMGADVKVMLKMLRGNGEPGIVTQLALQRKDIETLSKSNSRLWKLLGSVSFILLSGLVSLFFI